MSADKPLRFLHASDFRMDEPLRGLSHVPPHLQELLADAPYVAARRVFDCALSQEVDFLLLAGRLLHPAHGGPRGLAFLAEQFERLQEQEIPVYWAASDIDHPERWPAGCQAWDQVHVFSLSQVEEVSHFRDDLPLATIMGRSGSGGGARADEFVGEYGEQFTIAVTAALGDSKSLSRQRIDYWALGGRGSRETLFSKPRCAHDPGMPQARSCGQTGPYGCTLVQVEGGRARLTHLAADAVRWQTADIQAPRRATLESLETEIDDQSRRLAMEADRPLLVTWRVAGVERLEDVPRSGAWRGELADRLRKRHGEGDSALWTVSIEALLPEEPPDRWLEENTMLGDYLRELQEFDFHAADESALRGRLNELHPADDLPEHCDLGDRDEQARILREAAQLGADLLRGKA